MIGSILLTIALAMSIISMIMFYLNYRGYQNTLNYGRIAYHAMAMLVIIASTFLLYNILTHNYAIKYIYSYSSNELPKGILAATFWAGQEGSFMLWLLLTVIVGLILQSYASKRGDLEPRVMAVFTLATSFLLVMVSPMFKNPFEYIWMEPMFINATDINPAFFDQPWLQSFLFSDGSTGQNFVQMNQQLYATLSSVGISVKDFIIDGRGLNPQLLNFWMQIHPPILFIGFAMATVPFAFAISALMKNEYKDWIKQAFPWVLAGAGILGLGIMLGGYWAYEMLGWGGYWAWDPVENSSLIPWLVGVASIHTLLVQRKSQSKGGIGKYAKTNLMLCILTYVLVLYSTFLTRSGVLGDASVHSFVDPGMMVYLFLVLFIGSFILLGGGMMIYRWKYLNEHVVADDSLLSRDLALFTATIVLLASALIVLTGTSAPLFGSSVDTYFYDEMHLPLAIIIGLLNGISLLLKWNRTKGKDFVRRSIPSVVLSILVTAMIVVFGGVYNVMLILLAFSAAFTVFVNAEIAIKIIRGNKRMLGAYVAHIGIALFILGVIGSAAYSNEVDIDLVKNQPKEALGYEMIYTGYSPIDNGQKYQFNVQLKKGGNTYTVSPIMYISEFNQGLMREPAILTMVTRDFYVSPLGYDETGTENGHAHDITISKNETKEVDGVKLTFVNFDFNEEARNAMMSGGDFRIGVELKAEYDGTEETFEVALKSTAGERELTTHKLQDSDITVKLLNLDAGGTVELSVIKDEGTETTPQVTEKQEVLTITAAVKPFISLVWIGVLIMVVGFFVSVARRLPDSLIKS